MNTAWFYTVLYFGKRGHENQHKMKASDLQLRVGGLKDFVLNERVTKNHPGGISDNEDETQSVCLVIPGALLLVWRSIQLKESKGAMPYGKNQRITMPHCSVKMMTSGFAEFQWESTSLTIYSRKCARKLVWQLFIQLTASELPG